MANRYLASEIITDLRDRGLIPTSEDTLSDTRLLRLINDELQLYVTELLQSIREEYLVTYADQTVTAGTSNYRIPTRSVGSAIRRVCLVDSNGGERNLERVEPERKPDVSLSGSPTGYVFAGNYLQLLPAPSTGDTLRIYYTQRLNNVVASTAVGEITAVNTGTRQVTISSAPSTFTSTATGTDSIARPIYDIVRGTPHFDTLAQDQSVTVAGTTLTFASSLPTGISIGDYVCLAGESPIPQVPPEVHTLLVNRVTEIALKSLGDPRAAVHEKGTAEARLLVVRLLSPRDRGTARVIINKYGPGW